MEGRLLLEFAESQGRLLLTLDKDFCQIALQRRVPLEESGVILFRIHPATPENLDPLVQAFLKSNRVWPGNIGIVDASGIQMLPARRT